MEIPSLVENTLAQLGVLTIDDLLRLAMDDLHAMKGVGVSKIKAISELKTLALRLIDGNSDHHVEKTYLLDELIAAGIDPDMPWRNVLTRLDRRVHNVFERESFTTLRDVVLRYESNTLTDLSGIGQNSNERLGKQLDELIRLGLDAFLYGEDGAPKTLNETIKRGLFELDEMDQMILERRYVDQETLEQISDVFDMTREGIRQRIERALSAINQQFGHAIEPVLEDIMDICFQQGGLMKIDEALASISCKHSHVLFLAFDVCQCHYEQQNDFFSIMEESQWSSFLSNMETFVRQRDEHILVSQLLVEYASEIGVNLPDNQLINLLSYLWKTKTHPDGLIHPWMDQTAQYAAVLKSYGAALHIEELCRLIQETYQKQEPPSERHVYLYLQRADEVFYVDRGTYLHIENLPIAYKDLRKAAKWSADQIKDKDHAVSASIFIEPLLKKKLINDEVTPLLLRDAMSRLEDIKTFQSTDFVAHLDTFEGQRKTQEEHVETILLATHKTLSCDDVCEQYPKYLTCSRGAIYTTLSQAKFALNLGQGRFIHKAQIGLTELAQQQLIDAAIECLRAQNTPMTSASILEMLALPAAAFLGVHERGADILWALLKNNTQIVGGKGQLLGMADDTLDIQEPLSRAILNIMKKSVILTPAQIRKEIIFQYSYLANHGPIYDAIERVIERGYMRTFLNQWRIINDADPVDVFSAFVDPERGYKLPSTWSDFDDETMQDWKALLHWIGSTTAHDLLAKIESE